MKALVVLREDNSKWTSPLPHSGHSAMIRICNKPLLEYFVDFLVLSRADSIVFNSETPVPEIESYFGSGERWGICIKYRQIKNDESIDRIIEKNDIYAWCSSFPLVIFDGLFFIHYDKSELNSDWINRMNTGILTACSSGSLLIAPKVQDLMNISSIRTDIPISLSKLESLDDYFRITMEILSAEQKHYVLPGYREKGEIIFGKNVKTGEDVDIIPPVILGNNVRLMDKVKVGPYVVLGENVILEEKSDAENSIILSNSYIGPGLRLSKNVVDGNRVIEVPRGEMVEIDDDTLVSRLPETSEYAMDTIGVRLKGFIKRVWHFINKNDSRFWPSRGQTVKHWDE